MQPSACSFSTGNMFRNMFKSLKKFFSDLEMLSEKQKMKKGRRQGKDDNKKLSIVLKGTLGREDFKRSTAKGWTRVLSHIFTAIDKNPSVINPLRQSSVV